MKRTIFPTKPAKVKASAKVDNVVIKEAETYLDNRTNDNGKDPYEGYYKSDLYSDSSVEPLDFS